MGNQILPVWNLNFEYYAPRLVDTGSNLTSMEFKPPIEELVHIASCDQILPVWNLNTYKLRILS